MIYWLSNTGKVYYLYRNECDNLYYIICSSNVGQHGFPVSLDYRNKLGSAVYSIKHDELVKYAMRRKWQKFEV